MQKNWRKMLTELGGWDNELLSVPAGAVREIIEEVEALRESARVHATIIATKDGEIAALTDEVTHLAGKLAERDAAGVDCYGAPRFDSEVIASLESLGYTREIPSCIPQPYAGAIALLENFAQTGMVVTSIDGKPTPNAVLCMRFADELRAALAAPQPVDAAPKDAKATPDLQWRYQKYLDWCERSNYAALSWSDFVESRTNSGQRHHKPMTYGPAVDAAQAVPELTDDQIKGVAINYGAHVAGDVYDVTKYDCAEDFFNCVRACLALAAPSPAAQPAAQAAPEGFALVPLDPTDAMVNAYLANCTGGHAECIKHRFYYDAYNAMLAAATVAQPTDTTAGA